MKRLNLLFLFIVLSTTSFATEKVIDLSGKWHLQIDRTDTGENEKWFNSLVGDQINLPGSMTTNGKGDEVTLFTPWTGQIVDSSWFKEDRYAKYRTKENLKIPAWLQPIKYYKGAAWYTKEITITEDISSRPLLVTFERPHWETSLWIDGVFYGLQNSLGTPHKYHITSLKTGKHIIAVRVDNRIKSVDVGYNAHSVSDHTQSNWNGIVGEMSIKTIEDISIKNVQIYPNIEKKEVTVVLTSTNLTPTDKLVRLTLQASSRFTPKLHKPQAKTIDINVSKGVDTTELTYPMGEFYMWDEFTPYLYTMSVTLAADTKEFQFGMRNFEARGKLFYINDRPIFLRGTLECAIFPKTGFPAMDQEEWSRIFNICKSHGLNHVRFHSWCPPRAAFLAADRLGVYIQVEGGAWCSVGDGGEFDKWAYKEADNILDEYGNHPSFILYTYGNEPGGKNQNRFLGDLIKHLANKDSRHLYTSGAGWPSIPENQYRNDMYPRLKVWGAECVINSEKPRYDYNFDKLTGSFTIPWVSHEIGEWCVYPDFKEINMYDGAVLQAKNFEIFRETLSANGMEELSEKFLMASGKLQTILYKTEIESAMRTKNFGGYQLLDLHDFPGQGTALVGG
ncbi:MAG: glycoside hydrolase family 2 TIM barrel-domain containing protein, partial [Mucinivorans sp.]